jgi:YegS/Rv2252/BmrU family lipid kinase
MSIKATLIANPRTGRYGSRLRPSLEAICAFLNAEGFEVELEATTAPGDATRIAARVARSGMRTVIVAGGDGTINEALQGLIGAPVTLGIIPRGTANVLARELGLPLDDLEAAAVIVNGNAQRIHVGCATNESGVRRFFFLMAGIGLDASVVTRVNPRLKKYFGKAAFWLSGLSHLADWKANPFHLRINGEDLEATFAAVGNAASYGGKLAVTPRARLDQPDFEVCVISSKSRLRYLRLLPFVMREGLPVDTKGVRYLRATAVTAWGDALVQVDGEVIGKLPMSFTIAPETIELIVR